MPLEFLRQNSINLPVVGSVSIAAAVAVGAILFFTLRRKKSIGIKI